MSSLLQSPGRSMRRGGIAKHEIFVYLVRDNGTACGEEIQLEALPYPPGHRHYGGISIQPVLYRIWRKPVGMFGPWVVFRINGEESVPDLSVPVRLHKIPRDAERLTTQEAIQYWFTP